MVLQKFELTPPYRFLCMGCEHPIDDGQFFVEVRQLRVDDADARLAVHVGCLGRLRQPGIQDDKHPLSP